MKTFAYIIAVGAYLAAIYGIFTHDFLFAAVMIGFGIAARQEALAQRDYEDVYDGGYSAGYVAGVIAVAQERADGELDDSDDEERAA